VEAYRHAEEDVEEEEEEGQSGVGFR